MIGIIFTISLTCVFKKYYRPLVWNPTPIVFGLLIGMMLSIIYLSQDEKELESVARENHRPGHGDQSLAQTHSGEGAVDAVSFFTASGLKVQQSRSVRLWQPGHPP